MRNVARSTRPPSKLVVSVSISASLSACSSRRGAAPSFQSETIASDTGSSERTTTTTAGPPGRASSCTSVADASSSRCASSTQINIRSLGLESRSAPTMAPSTLSRGASRSSVGTRWARADKGTDRAAWVPIACSIVQPSAANRVASSSSSRLLPTPAGPATTTGFPLSSTPAAYSTSASRPTRGKAELEGFISEVLSSRTTRATCAPVRARTARE